MKHRDAPRKISINILHVARIKDARNTTHTRAYIHTHTHVRGNFYTTQKAYLYNIYRYIYISCINIRYFAQRSLVPRDC